MRHPSRTMSARGGFTLVEIMLAIGIILALVGAILAFYDYTVTMRRGISNEAEMLSAERTIMDRLTMEFRTAMIYPFLSRGMEGEPNKVSFPATVVPGPAAWAVRKTTEQWIPPESDLEIVGYQLRVVTYEDGSSEITGLERTCQKNMLPPPISDGNEITVSLLTPNIKFLNLRYWDGANWLDRWSGGDLPKAVEITMGSEPLPAEMAPDLYPYTKFRRVVYLPGRPLVSSGMLVPQTRPAADGGTGLGTGTGTGTGTGSGP